MRGVERRKVVTVDGSKDGKSNGGKSGGVM